jgi:hypothetical protein
MQMVAEISNEVEVIERNDMDMMLDIQQNDGL